MNINDEQKKSHLNYNLNKVQETKATLYEIIKFCKNHEEFP